MKFRLIIADGTVDRNLLLYKGSRFFSRIGAARRDLEVIIGRIRYEE